MQKVFSHFKTVFRMYFIFDLLVLLWHNKCPGSARTTTASAAASLLDMLVLYKPYRQLNLLLLIQINLGAKGAFLFLSCALAQFGEIGFWLLVLARICTKYSQCPSTSHNQNARTRLQNRSVVKLKKKQQTNWFFSTLFKKIKYKRLEMHTPITNSPSTGINEVVGASCWYWSHLF